MPHEKALQRNVSNEYQMIVNQYIYIYIYNPKALLIASNSHNHINKFDRKFKLKCKNIFEIFVRFRCREKRKPNVGRGNILWL